MKDDMPKLGAGLKENDLKLLNALAKSCRRSIIEMTSKAQSGHPGGSLSSIDYLTLLYAYIIGRSGEKIVVSNGHISPAVYAILAEMGYIPKEKAIETFRKLGSIYEGHVTRHVNGVWYGTGPLGIGVSVAAAFALAEKLKKSGEKVFAVMGDGEAQEGQVYEMMLFANKYKLNNLVLFVDKNLLQLTGSLEDIMPTDLHSIFKAGNWEVIECNGHDFGEMWKALGKAYKSKDKPVVILGNTIMGKGVDYMEKDWVNRKSTWHGKVPDQKQSEEAMAKFSVAPEDLSLLDKFRKQVKWHPAKPVFQASLQPILIDTGNPVLYDPATTTDCRSAYGQALLDLARLNRSILAMSADLSSSVMTKHVAAEIPDQHIECGISEQNMVSVAGGLSLDGFIPFCSTFGAFITSRAKDQARLNDINRTNVKMVATHCGLSVGEDGPTHQAIDDSGSFLGLFNTMLIEPVDPNHTDRIIRYIASHYGNFYVRMGRHKVPVITKEDGSPLYDGNYRYEYGRCDVVREGKDITIAAMGPMVAEALMGRERLKRSKPELSVEIVAVSSIKKFDHVLVDSIKKTGNLITVEDHNVFSGLGSQISRHLLKEGITLRKFHTIGVSEYQLSGKPQELYVKAGLCAEAIEKACL
jgi:transketolase